MAITRIFAAFVFLSIGSWNASAQELSMHLSVMATIKAQFPERDFNIWSDAKGDLNGDGIPDLALVITASNMESEREERLVVLIGNKDKSYSLLSASDEFCHVRYHYNLDVHKRSLNIRGFSNLHGSSFGLQFKYNDKRKDLELIMDDVIDESEDGNSFSSMRINYLDKKIIYSRKQNKRHKEVVVKFAASEPRGLRGFNCGNYGEDLKERNFYIADDFSFKHW